jgi:hypothetical protein
LLTLFFTIAPAHKDLFPRYKEVEPYLQSDMIKVRIGDITKFGRCNVLM